MSIASPFESESGIPGRRLGERSLYMLLPAIRFVGFWAAVLLPFVLMGLIASGAVVNHPSVVAALFVANMLGLVVGRNYNR
jgi:hypothetical protein